MKKCISLALGILSSSMAMASSDSNTLDNITMNIIEESHQEDVARGLIMDNGLNESSNIYGLNEMLDNDSFTNGSQETILDEINLFELTQGGLDNATQLYDPTGGDGEQIFIDDTPSGDDQVPDLPGFDDNLDISEDPIDFPIPEDPDDAAPSVDIPA